MRHDKRIELIPFKEIYPSIVEVLEYTKQEQFGGLYEELKPKFDGLTGRYALLRYMIEEMPELDEATKVHEAHSLDLSANRLYLTIVEQTHQLTGADEFYSREF